MTASPETATDFPVRWDDPADASICWEYEREHVPDGMTPLGFDLYFGPFLGGFGWARAYLQNYYVFVWYSMPEGGDAPKVDLDQLAGWVRNWHEKIIPEVEGHTQRFLRTDFDALSDVDLAAEIEKLPELRARMGHLHTRALFPHWVGMRHLINTYKELTGHDDELAALRLVQGYGSKSVDAGVALWRLSRLAASVPAVIDTLLSRLDTPATIAALDREPAARPFLDAFSQFLDEFGWRSDLFELATPTWAEDPTIPLHQLRGYLDLPDYDPATEQQRLAADREDAIQATLAGLAPEARAQLQAVLDVVKGAVNLQEDHNYYIDQRCAFSPRRLVLAAARRLVANGALAEANDVFYLRPAELVGALRDGATPLHATVDGRKAEMQRWAAIEPPPWIGAPPADSESESPAAMGGHGSKELRSNGASAGVARGPARVLMSLAEADRFRPGDVLVARTTMPAWTPLFAPAAAIITESGGVLSHAAVTAREYATPAVLNVVDATRLIRDGQLVEVDGSAGIVRLLS